MTQTQGQGATSRRFNESCTPAKALPVCSSHAWASETGTSDEQTTKDCQEDSRALNLLTGHLSVGIEEVHASRHWCCRCISKQLEGLDEATQNLQSAAGCTPSWLPLNKTGQQSPGYSQLSSAVVKLSPCCDTHVAQFTSAFTLMVTAGMDLSTSIAFIVTSRTDGLIWTGMHPQGMLHSV